MVTNLEAITGHGSFLQLKFDNLLFKKKQLNSRFETLVVIIK